MNRNEQEDQTKQELPGEAKKAESNYVINAFIIGLFIGISIYSIAINGWGFFAFIPLYLASVVSGYKSNRFNWLQISPSLFCNRVLLNS